MIMIKKICLPTPGMDELLAEATAEGYDFVETLVDDWASAANRFDGPGEALFGGYQQELLVAVGGLNKDPFAGQAGMGRIRRVFVRRAWRNAGVGRALVSALVEEARQSFDSVRLRAENADAARLYERMGFLPLNSPDATHVLLLKKKLQLIEQTPLCVKI
jgi:GNAT superfamily N-acetyltransferase